MNNELKQQLSEFLDHELAPEAALELLQKARSDSAIGDTLNRYAIISQALKEQRISLVDQDFSAKIARQIEQEPAFLLPIRKRPATATRRYRALAMAASLAAVLVLASHKPEVLMLASRAPDKPAPSNPPALQVAEQTAPATATAANPEQTPLNARIHDYLQAHSNSVYTGGEPDLKPLVTVTSYANPK